MNKVECLIISNTYDFTTDYVCHELINRKKSFLRLNRDKFNEYEISIDVDTTTMTVIINNKYYQISEDSLKSIYYRAPVFLRDNFQPNLTLEQQLYRSQWSSFIRNLIVFNKCIWMNHPSKTYIAENKILQQKYARKIGFKCPKTIVTNSHKLNDFGDGECIVKSLDTALFKEGNMESFVYTNVINYNELRNYDLSMSPIILQEYLNPKIDLRVTVIEKKVYAVKILYGNNGISGDWRKQKEKLTYILFQLPENIEEMCIQLVKKLELKFGAIDLAIVNNEYYFIEINPTGEWAWLVEAAKQPTYINICDSLLGEYNEQNN